MKAPSPAFSLYPKDMLTDEHVSAMTHTEFGIYIRLLLHAWLEGSIPAEPVKLCRILKLNRNMFNRLWVAISPCFQERDGRLFQQRLEAEREKQLVRSEESRRKGLLGGRPMESTKHKSPGLADAKPNESLPSPSSFNVLTPLPPKGGPAKAGSNGASRTEQERLRLEADEKLRDIADYWSERFGRTGRQLGVLRAAKQAFAAGYEANTLRLVIRTAAACSQNPDRYPPRSSFRWAVDNSRLGPEYLLRPSTLDRLVPEGESWERE